jgi:hypothetical protein
MLQAALIFGLEHLSALPNAIRPHRLPPAGCDGSFLVSKLSTVYEDYYSSFMAPDHNKQCATLTLIIEECQDLLYSMYSATMSIVVSCLLFTRLGPDHPGARPAML